MKGPRRGDDRVDLGGIGLLVVVGPIQGVGDRVEVPAACMTDFMVMKLRLRISKGGQISIPARIRHRWGTFLVGGPAAPQVRAFLRAGETAVATANPTSSPLPLPSSSGRSRSQVRDETICVRDQPTRACRRPRVGSRAWKVPSTCGNALVILPV